MKELFKNIKRIWPYFKKHKKYIIGMMICSILSITISIAVPIYNARLIIHLTNSIFTKLILTAIVILLLEISWSVLDFFQDMFIQKLYRESRYELEMKLGSEVLKLSDATLKHNGTGLFIERINSDTDTIAGCFTDLNRYIGNILKGIGIFIAIFIINKIAFIFLIVRLIILFIVQHKRVTELTNNQKKYRKERDKLTSFVGELVRGASDIKMLNAENSFLSSLDKKIKENNSISYKTRRINKNYILVEDVISNFFDFMLIVLLVMLIMNNNIEIATALIIHSYSNNIWSLSNIVSWFFDIAKDFNISTNRIFEIIDNEKYEKEIFGNTNLKHIEGNFEFKNVCFAYDKQKVLKDLSFSVNANETVAFVGKSGAGKSTIFNLLCKLYDNYKGMITIDGVDIKELDKNTIRGNITIISQSPYIFNLSIKDNLKIVKENLTTKEMKEACRLACLDEFIESLPDKYDTVVGEGGVTLSGGQKQRLAIARALVQKTEIILFDEATSALDNETQSKIQEAINNMKKEYTILIIAHRLSTIINADRILYLENGKIIASGSHKELLKTCKSYKALYEAEIIKKR